MVRNVFRLFLVFVAAVFVRQVLILIGRGFSRMASQSTETPPNPTRAREPQSSGELKRDPVCGTFVATASSVTRNIDGKIVHFCSIACRDKYQVA
jgi:YHS domain-containing protein